MRLPQAVAGRATIIIDSGFMRGTDVVKAMALGADLVGVGRMAAFALAAGAMPTPCRPRSAGRSALSGYWSADVA